MRAVLFVLAGLACAGHARRVQMASEGIQSKSDKSSSNPSRALAELMQSSTPAAAFRPSGLAAPLVPSHAVSTPAVAARVEDPSMMAKRKAKKAAAKPKKGKTAAGVAGLPGITTDTAALVGRSDDSWLSVFDSKGLGYFDPAGFTIGASPRAIRSYREAELKHGRIAMLASLGFVVAEKFHPLFGGSIDTPSLFAIKDPELLDQVSPLGWGLLLTLIFALEGISATTVFYPPEKESWGPAGSLDMSKVEAGDIFAPFGATFDPLGLKPSTPAEFKVMQTKELNNGRLAMLAILGMALQEAKTGSTLF